MTAVTQPTQWATTICNSGDANIIPQSTTVGTGEASFDDGFPQITQVPLGAGGIAPDRKDFNGLFKLLGDWLFYIQNGGVPTYNNAYDYVEGRIVLHTDNRIYLCIQANDHTDPKAPTNANYWSKITFLADIITLLVPTGVILPFSGTAGSIPSGYLLCNGASISRTLYANLYAVTGTKYGIGDGSTTFNIPDLRDKYIIGANTNPLGTYINEQLPNSKGTLLASRLGIYLGSNIATGGFANTQGSATAGAGFDSAKADIKLDYDSSRSSSIYTDGGHVYPSSLATNYIIRY